ncbi:MAG: tRNA modification GTPase [Planctomycetota bacterium]|jgi:tRNA modification GTPase
MPPTILAVASPPGRSARGIVRLSGPRTFALLDDRLNIPGCRPPASHARDESPPARGLHAARLRLDDHDLPVLALLFPGPRSYTGEDAAEIQLPGNPALLERVIDALLDAARARDLDARRAEPGEFTARAFFHGRLSLTEAEGVAATIAARSDAALRAAALLRDGTFGHLAADWSADLARVLALVEAGIDFTDEEDVVPITPAALLERLRALRGAISMQLDRAIGMEQLEAIPWVVLTGRANAGKSTLFNALLGRRRAVVSPVAGTTRDVLAEPLSIDTDHGAAEVMLVDLAGAEDARTSMDRRVQQAAREALRRAELRLHCVPAGEPAPAVDDASILVRTKIDVATEDDEIADARGESALHVSAVTGAGLHDVRHAIGTRLADHAVSLAADTLALQPRHESALATAAAHLRDAIALVEPQSSAAALTEPELIAASMRLALDDLAMLAGEMTPDDVLGLVFSTFCIGK